MAIQKRNADVEEIYGRLNDFGMKTRYDFSDIRISNRRKRILKICKKWSIGSNYTGDGNTADNITNIDNKNKITNEIGVGNFEHSEQKSDWSIGSNNEGNKNSANGNTNICNNQNHNHKNTNVFKAGNVGNNGKKRAFSFISDLWGGNTSDRYITEHSGFLDSIKPGDEIMADRGFTIRDLLTDRRATLVIPPFTKKCKWEKGNDSLQQMLLKESTGN
ncbi:unnamed protein product [Mytilus edulis]|uniref:DDE Tnp4 domain-containing protein n=1 Tax=Mytilus edulis TaxID=6550 RepID=A0A8S3UGN2_MYTED|nr:unnamed protein product [Mytilus edulis]